VQFSKVTKDIFKSTTFCDYCTSCWYIYATDGGDGEVLALLHGNNTVQCNVIEEEDRTYITSDEAKDWKVPSGCANGDVAERCVAEWLANLKEEAKMDDDDAEYELLELAERTQHLAPDFPWGIMTKIGIGNYVETD